MWGNQGNAHAPRHPPVYRADEEIANVRGMVATNTPITQRKSATVGGRVVWGRVGAVWGPWWASGGRWGINARGPLDDVKRRVRAGITAHVAAPAGNRHRRGIPEPT